MATRTPPPAQRGRQQAAPPPAPRQQQPARPQDDGWEGVDAIDLEDTGFGGGLIPAGLYAVEIDKVYFRQAKSGKDHVNIEARITRGDFEGRMLFLPFYITSDKDEFRKGQKGFLRRTFEVCTGQIPEVLPNNDDELSPLVGTECGFKVNIEPNTDQNGNAIEVNRVIRVIDVRDVPANQDPQFDEQEPAPAPQRGRAAAQATLQRGAAAAPQQHARGNGQQRSGTPRGNAPRGATGFEDMEDDIPT